MHVNPVILTRTLTQLKENLRERQNQTAISSYSYMPARLQILTTGWGSLPYNVLQQIFSHLDNDYLIKYCTLVCKHWRRSIMNDIFIKHFTITGTEIPLFFVYDFLRRYKSLHSLNLINVPNPLPILMQANKVTTHLKKISLDHYKHIDAKVLTYITKVFPRLEALSLESSNIDTINLSSEIMLLSELKSLNLFNVKTISASTNLILEIVLNCRELEELNIGLTPPLVNLHDDDVLVIITNLAPKLTSLTLDARLLTLRSLDKLKDCVKLHRLYIKYGVNLTGEFLTEFWKNLWHVDRLGFTHNCIITGCNVSELFLNGAQVFTGITHLDFTYCVLLSDVAIETIAHVCKQLREIVLKSCRSVLSIDSLCTKCKQLRMVDISYCTQLKMNFTLPKQLEVLIVDERKKMLYYVEKFKHFKYLRIYVSLSEFDDNLQRL